MPTLLGQGGIYVHIYIVIDMSHSHIYDFQGQQNAIQKQTYSRDTMHG